jgi:hypothetical protein
MNNLKQIFNFSIGKINLFGNFKFKYFIAIDMKRIDISFEVDNFSFFILNETNGIEL